MMRAARRVGVLLRERFFPLGIPLAWRQLVAEKKRFAAAVAGITFAVTMMLYQMGLESALFDQVVAPLLQMNGDIVLISPQYEYFGISREFPQTRLTQASSLPEVFDTAALLQGTLPFKNPQTGRDRDIFVMAFNPSDYPFTNPDIVNHQALLKRDRMVLFDTLSRADYGPIGELFAQKGEVTTEIAGKSAKVVGVFEMGPTFAADGNLLMGRDAFLALWPSARENQISIGLLQLKPGADPNAVAQKLRTKLTAGDVDVYTRDEFIQKEKTYWSQRTPIGFVIGASLLVSLIVGAVIVYQILYTDVTDHLHEYATLKSIGFTDGFFVKLVLQESLILSILGFVPGTGLAALLYWLTQTLGHMPTKLYAINVLGVFGLSLMMCLLAGGLATRKLRQANPADIF